MDFYYVYILESLKDGKIYRLYRNLRSRFERHNAGQVESTKHRRPLKLIYFEACLTLDDALRRENT
ncbi:GIY-YIG nuclease family protein [Rhodohalobacter halophilus]|uniref:GIY-YIG nuclease family protein n=1 Tax=Rhodohalobacter halophilus TaxID=1812810 RepID=UPI001C401D0C